MTSNGAQEYNTTAIRDLLRAAFTAEELQRLFLYTDDRDLRPLVLEFGDGESLVARVDKVIVWCEKRRQLPALLAEVRRERPEQYARFAPRLHISEPIGPQSAPFDPLLKDRANELQNYIRNAVSAYEARMYQLLARPASPPSQPYKFLFAFEIQDATIFFGRDAAAGALYETIFKDRMTVLHAKSGAGKTSLLNAGLSPRLIHEHYLPVYARAYDDPVQAIKRVFAPPSWAPWPDLLSQLTLHEFLGHVCAHLSRKTQGLVLVLDQFEEFFIFWPEQEHRQPFIDILADCYDDPELPVRFVIGIRKDYYSDLATFQNRMRHIFHNEYYLKSMVREEAEAAITRPVSKLDDIVTYEPAVLDELLGDLMAGGMALPHLQIICTDLYKGLAEGETMITLDAYEAAGRAQGILGRYLEKVLDRLPGRGAIIAKAALTELVSSEATKRVLSYEMLAAKVDAEDDDLEDVLARLVDARLLRRDEVGGEVVYEMAHEYLIGEMTQWMDRKNLAFKQAEELLAREVANWRVHRTPIPKDRLELLHAHREQFKGLDNEVWACILRSALKADSVMEDWARLAGLKPLIAALGDEDPFVREAAATALGEIGEPAVEPLIAALGDEDRNVRSAAAKALGRLGNARAVEPLIAALGDEARDVRSAAAGALGRFGEPAVEPLITALGDEDPLVRNVAAEALGRLGNARAVEPLIATLGDEDPLVRSAAARALRRFGEPAVEPLIAALGDEDLEVPWMAAEALEEIGKPAVEPFIAALGEEDHQVSFMAAWALEEIGEPAVEPLIAALGEEDHQVSFMAAWALERIGEPAVEPLIAALGDEDRNVRSAAARALGRLGNARAVEPLIAALGDEDRNVRSAATRALEEIGEPAVEPLITALGDEDPFVREAVATALRRFGEPAVEPLIAALGDEEFFVREAAATALEEIGEPAVMPFIAALGDEDPLVRSAAARALRRMGGPEARAALTPGIRT
jgi:HEAT repeat protein